MPKIVAGQEFDSLADFKAELRAWAVEDSFSPAILDSDARRVRVGCRTSRNCPFRIRCNFDPAENKARVGTLVAKHTCDGQTENSGVFRGEVTKMSFLLEAVPQLMIIDRSTPSKDIIENVKNRYGQQISLRQAQKVKSTLLSIASEQLGKGLYARMKESLGDDATEEELRRGKRLRVEDDTVDPRLYEKASDPDHQNDGQFQDFGDDDMEDYEENYDETFVEDFELRTAHEPRFEKVIGEVSQLEADMGQVLDQATNHTGPSAADLRAQAALLFQQASKKFQEATQLHTQASALFSQAMDLENGPRGG